MGGIELKTKIRLFPEAFRRWLRGRDDVLEVWVAIGSAFQIFRKFEVAMVDGRGDVRDTRAVVKQKSRMRGLALNRHHENGQIEHDIVCRIQSRAVVRAVVKSAFQ